MSLPCNGRAGMTAPRYPFAPIDAMFEPSKGYLMPEAERPLSIYEGLDTHREQLRRWRENGLTTEWADKLAVRLGMNAVDIWPSWYDDAALEPACPVCDEPLFEGRTYCSTEHKELARREAQAAAGRAKRAAARAAKAAA